ncbi:hypothetical protein QQ020_08025 [Fulvivirgaceae bacterium BMA12]|uniref:Uncharacterized protein n=1 Tax=Agaribacillus aureus TaxID=3051825 RepID=A0ABT8L2R9_9BACT|nr:hypothetical protein [Fulvivirgaceae bacterium BMA12]
MPKRISIHIFTLFLLYPGWLCAQQLRPNGLFLSDSVKIGEEVAYSLSIEYERDKNLIFPDSLYDFAPFEYIKKVEFPTKSDSAKSFDSVIYYLNTFEVDPVQKLALPIFLTAAGDSISYFAQEDSILLQQLIKQMPDSIVLKENSAYSDVKLDFNYPYLIFALCLLILVAIAVILLFGKQIKRKISLYRLRKQHEKFLLTFNRMLSNTQNRKEDAESLLLVWKKYMEKLERAPFTKLTTKEIVQIRPDDTLKSNLKTIDKGIYGHENLKNLTISFSELKDYAFERLNIKMNLIKNAK